MTIESWERKQSRDQKLKASLYSNEYECLVRIVLQSRKREFRLADYFRQRDRAAWLNERTAVSVNTAGLERRSLNWKLYKIL